MKTPLRYLGISLGCLLTFAAIAQADTIAYWRFEDQFSSGSSFGTLQGNLGGDPHTTTQDYSGNGNSLRTYNNDLNSPGVGYGGSGPATSPNFGNGGGPATTIPQTGAPNDKWAYFSGGQDIYTDPANTFTGGQINLTTYNFTSDFTIQASIYSNTPAASPSNLQAFHTFLGKDNSFANGVNPLALLYFQQTNAGYLGFSAYDSAGNYNVVSTTFNISNTDTLWTNVALVSKGTTLSLYAERSVAQGGTGTYQLVGSATTAGGLLNQAGTWSVGRGQFSGAPADQWIGGVDEVKIDNTALDPSQFLFSQVPEPGTIALSVVGLGALALFVRRTKRQRA